MPVLSPAAAMNMLITLFVLCTLVAIPGAAILRRLGYNRAWALLCYVPILALVGIWALAFIQWPGTERLES